MLRHSTVAVLISLSSVLAQGGDGPGTDAAPSSAALARYAARLQTSAGRADATTAFKATPKRSAKFLLEHLVSLPLQQRAVVNNVIVALGPSVYPIWMEAIRTGSSQQRQVAIRAVEAFERNATPKQLVDLLIETIGDEDQGAAMMAGYISVFNETAGLDALSESLYRVVDRRSRDRIAIALGLRRGLPTPYAVLTAGRQDPNTYYRYLTYQELSRTQPLNLALWREALNDSHPWSRGIGIAMVAKLATTEPEAVRTLSEYLSVVPSGDWSIDLEEAWRQQTEVGGRMSTAGSAAVPVLRTILARPMPEDPRARAACLLFYQSAFDAIIELGADALPLMNLVNDHCERSRLDIATLTGAINALAALPVPENASVLRGRVDRMRDLIYRASTLRPSSERASFVTAICSLLGSAGPAAKRATNGLADLLEDPTAAAAVCSVLVQLSDQFDSHIAAALSSPGSAETGHELLCRALGSRGAGSEKFITHLLRLARRGDVSLDAKRAAIGAAMAIGLHLSAEKRRAIGKELHAFGAYQLMSETAAAAVRLWPESVGEFLTATKRKLSDPERAAIRSVLSTHPERLVPYFDHERVEVRTRAVNEFRRVRPDALEPSGLAALSILVSKPELRQPHLVLRCFTRFAGANSKTAAVAESWWGRGQAGSASNLLAKAKEKAVPFLEAKLEADEVSLEEIRHIGHVIQKLSCLSAPLAVSLARRITVRGPEESEVKAAQREEYNRALALALAFSGPAGIRELLKAPLPEEMRLESLRRAFLSEGDDRARLAVGGSLAALEYKITNVSAYVLPKRWFKKASTTRRNRWILNLIQLETNPKHLRQLLLEALAQPTPSVRRHAVRHLAVIDSKISRAELFMILRLVQHDPDEGVRKLVAERLHALGGK